MDAPPVEYARTTDGYDIAYAVSGQGRPLVWMPQIFSHIELYWRQNTFLRPWLEGLAARFCLVQYDGRGQGMSSRGLPENHSLVEHALDLQAVVDRLHLDSFVLLAVESSGHVAVQYTVEHPERVEALILQACPVRGKALPTIIGESLASADWEIFIRNSVTLGQSEDVRGSVERLKQTITQKDYLALSRSATASDIGDLLPRLRVPTLIIHPRDYLMPVDEAMKLASRIPGARLTLTDGATAPGDATQGLQAIEEFVRQVPHIEAPAAAFSSSLRNGEPGRDSLSSRETEVLRLLAIGYSNQQIADRLVISRNTVRRHVSNIFNKVGARSRALAAIYARDHGFI